MQLRKFPAAERTKRLGPGEPKAKTGSHAQLWFLCVRTGEKFPLERFAPWALVGSKPNLALLFVMALFGLRSGWVLTMMYNLELFSCKQKGQKPDSRYTYAF